MHTSTIQASLNSYTGAEGKKRRNSMQAATSGLGPRSSSTGNLMHLFHSSNASVAHPLSRLRAEGHCKSHHNLAALGPGAQSHSWSGAARQQASGMHSGLGSQQASVQAQAPPAQSEATTKATSHGPSLPPTASLTRVFLIGQPSNIMRNLAGRKWRSAGPVSLLLFLFGLVLAILAAVRSVLVRKVRACQCCKGFGIVRCRLCNGDGSVAWTGKNNHQENCPLCMTKRYVTCPDCGGHYNRRLFTHIKMNSRGPVPDFLGAT